MNTLPRAITAQVLADPTLYHNLRRHWSELMRSPRKYELKVSHHLLYLALMGKDWRKSFTRATNQRKLDNGAFQGWILFRAMATLHMPSQETDFLIPFDGLVTPAVLQHVRRLISIQLPYKFKPDQFEPESFPFEAYSMTGSASAMMPIKETDSNA